jgi:virulence-associated protein VagC
MQTVDIVETDTGQIIHLPPEFHIDAPTVSIRRQGDAVILEPASPSRWPDHFFDDIRIDDPAFTRPDQGPTPRTVSLD